jgi:hypothetical protein
MSSIMSSQNCYIAGRESAIAARIDHGVKMAGHVSPLEILGVIL